MKETSVKTVLEVWNKHCQNKKNNHYNKVDCLSLFDEHGFNSEPLGYISTTQRER